MSAPDNATTGECICCGDPRCGETCGSPDYCCAGCPAALALRSRKADNATPPAQGAAPKEWDGAVYAYKTGDWSYEELKEHKRALLAEKKIVWEALGFEKTWMHTADEVAARALALRGHWFKRWINRLFRVQR